MAKVLLVEDDNNLREIYEARLQAEGYEIVSARDGEEALVVAKNEKPDLVISDVMMPKISGFEMLDILRNTQGLEDLKVIMLTALGQADDQARASQLGADRYLVKSQVTLEDIVNASHELLEGTAPAAPSDPTPPPATQPAEPVAPAGDVPTDTPAAEPPVPVAPAPPDPSPPVTPPTDPAVTSAASDAQTSAQEEATVEEQIENFVTAQPAEPPAAVDPAPTPEAPATPEVTTPETAPAETSPALKDGGPAAATDAPEAAAADDKLLANATDTLVQSANPTNVLPETEPAPAPLEGPSGAPNTEAPGSVSAPAPSDTSGSGGTKKVIQPLDSEQAPDINELLAREEAKDIVQPAAPQAPQPGPDTPAPGDKIDPNSIAL